VKVIVRPRARFKEPWPLSERMPELHAPPEVLIDALNSSVPWSEVAAEFGYDTPRDARNAALAAADRHGAARRTVDILPALKGEDSRPRWDITVRG